MRVNVAIGSAGRTRDPHGSARGSRKHRCIGLYQYDDPSRRTLHMPPISVVRSRAALAIAAAGAAVAVAAPGTAVAVSGHDSASAKGKAAVDLAGRPSHGGGRKIR